MIHQTEVQNFAYFLTKTLIQNVFREYIDENQLVQMMEHLNLRTEEEQIFFLTQLSVTLRKYPDSLFPNPDTRGKFLKTIQEFLDAKILAENN